MSDTCNFRRLLAESSLGLPSYVEPEDATSVPAGMCEFCRADRCGDGCAVPTGCACTCAADKDDLAREVRGALTALAVPVTEDDAAEVADAIYRAGWRPQ